MPQLLGRSSDGGYIYLTDDGRTVKSAMPVPGASGGINPTPGPDAPGVLHVPGMSPPTPAPPQPTPQSRPPVDNSPATQMLLQQIAAQGGVPVHDQDAAPGPNGVEAHTARDRLINIPEGGDAGGGYEMPSTEPQQVVHGGMQLAGRNRQRVEYQPDDVANLDTAGRAEERAAGGVEESQAVTAQQKAAAQKQQNEQLEDYDTGIAERERRREDALQRAQSEIADAQKDFDSRSYVDKGYDQFGGRILAGIAGGLAGLADAANGGRTNFSAQLDQSINKYIDEARDQAQSKVKGAQNLYQAMRLRFGDDRQAEAATRVALLDRAQRQIDTVVTQNAPAELQARAAAAKASISEQIAQQRAELNKQVVSEAERRTPDRVVGGGPPPGNVAPADANYVQLPDGTAIRAESPKAAAEIRQQFGGIHETKRAVDAASQILDSSAFNIGRDGGRLGFYLNAVANNAGRGQVGSTRGTPIAELEKLAEIFKTGHGNSDLLGQVRGALGAVREMTVNTEQQLYKAHPQRYSQELYNNGKASRVLLQRRGGRAAPTGANVAFRPAGGESEDDGGGE